MDLVVAIVLLLVVCGGVVHTILLRKLVDSIIYLLEIMRNARR